MSFGGVSFAQKYGKLWQYMYMYGNKEQVFAYMAKSDKNLFTCFKKIKKSSPDLRSADKFLLAIDEITIYNTLVWSKV